MLKRWDVKDIRTRSRLEHNRGLPYKVNEWGGERLADTLREPANLHANSSKPGNPTID
jgi:hypothetical protein